MRRWNTYQHINRNGTVGTLFDSNEESPDSLSPEIVMGQMWVQDDTTQVEIIELDSDGAEIASTEKQDNNFEQYWQYVDKDRFAMPEPEIYKANKKAREKRRMLQNMNHSNNEDSPENLENEFAEVINDIVYSSFYDNDTLDMKPNRQANCFTIVNKPFNSDSSSDETEFIDRADAQNHVNGDAPYDREIITFNQDVDSSKRTIWIYSFRNKRLLTDNDFELVNIPGQDSTSSTSCSLDNFCEESEVSKSTSRVSSPIPATYVPRLNLSMATTLPTVTEITEPTRNIPEETAKTADSPSNQHKSNNWCDEKVTTNGYLNHINKADKCSNTDIIDWMGLSPRERRRKSRQSKFSPTYESTLPTVEEVLSIGPKSNDSLTGNVHEVQTSAEIYLEVDKPDKDTMGSPKKGLLIVTDVTYVEPTEEKDYNKKLLRKPQITIGQSCPKSAIITDPLEKLDSNNWIIDDTKKEKQLLDTSESEIQELEDSSSYREPIVICAGSKLWTRNMSLLKPVAWSEFLPITESVPSLHLSIDSDSDKKSCLKRLAKCFRCFK